MGRARPSLTDTDIRGYGFIAFPIFGWGLAPIFVQFGLQYIDILTFFSYRFLLAFLLTVPYILVAKRREVSVLLKNKWTYFVAGAHAWAILAQYFSQLYISPSISATISYSYLILVPFVSAFLLTTEMSKKHLLFVLLAIVGVVLMVTQGNLSVFKTDLRGIAFAALSTLGFAFYITSASRLLNQEVENADSVSLYIIIIGIVSILGIGLALGSGGDINPANIPTEGWKYIGLLALFSTIMAYTAYIQSLKYLSPNTASVLLLLQIVIPYLIEGLFFDVTYSLWVLGGGLLVILASTLVILNSKDSLH